MESFLNEPAGVLVKSTCVDFPGLLAGSFFLKGCNLHCPYCYNTGLVLDNEPSENLSSLNDLYAYLEKRKGILSGFVISGGEPLLNLHIKEIIKKIKSLGYKIKLDTNGMLPDKLDELLQDPLTKPDFIAMDVKTSPDKYKLLFSQQQKLIPTEQEILEKLNKSINLISNLEKDHREWRTVLVPELVNVEDIKKMASLLPKDASWQFAQFQNTNCLNFKYQNILPYTDKEINELISLAKSYIPNAELR